MTKPQLQSSVWNSMYTTVIGHFEVVTLGQCCVKLQSGTLQGRYHISYY